MEIKDACFDRIKKQVKDWFVTANASSRGPHVVCSAALAVLEAIREKGWLIQERDYISDRNQILMSRNRLQSIVERILRKRPTVFARGGMWKDTNAPHDAA